MNDHSADDAVYYRHDDYFHIIPVIASVALVGCSVVLMFKYMLLTPHTVKG